MWTLKELGGWGAFGWQRKWSGFSMMRFSDSKIFIAIFHAINLTFINSFKNMVYLSCKIWRKKLFYGQIVTEQMDHNISQSIENISKKCQFLFNPKILNYFQIFFQLFHVYKALVFIFWIVGFAYCFLFSLSIIALLSLWICDVLI